MKVHSIATMRPLLLSIVVLVAVPSAPVFGQDSVAVVKRGDHVRVSYACRPRAGSVRCRQKQGPLMSLTADSVFLGGTAVPRSTMEGMELRTKQGHSGRGALIGVLIGAAAGGVMGAILSSEQNCGSDPLCALWYVITIPSGMLVGVISGAVIGGTSKWVDVPFEQLRVSFVPQRDVRFALGLSVRF